MVEKPTCPMIMGTYWTPFPSGHALCTQLHGTGIVIHKLLLNVSTSPAGKEEFLSSNQTTSTDSNRINMLYC